VIQGFNAGNAVFQRKKGCILREVAGAEPWPFAVVIYVVFKN
jgi:hypothetical protein